MCDDPLMSQGYNNQFVNRSAFAVESILDSSSRRVKDTSIRNEHFSSHGEECKGNSKLINTKEVAADTSSKSRAFELGINTEEPQLATVKGGVADPASSKIHAIELVNKSPSAAQGTVSLTPSEVSAIKLEKRNQEKVRVELASISFQELASLEAELVKGNNVADKIDAVRSYQRQVFGIRAIGWSVNQFTKLGGFGNGTSINDFDCQASIWKTTISNYYKAQSDRVEWNIGKVGPKCSKYEEFLKEFWSVKKAVNEKMKSLQFTHWELVYGKLSFVEGDDNNPNSLLDLIKESLSEISKQTARLEAWVTNYKLILARIREEHDRIAYNHRDYDDEAWRQSLESKETNEYLFTLECNRLNDSYESEKLYEQLQRICIQLIQEKKYAETALKSRDVWRNVKRLIDIDCERELTLFDDYIKKLWNDHLRRRTEVKEVQTDRVQRVRPKCAKYEFLLSETERLCNALRVLNMVDYDDHPVQTPEWNKDDPNIRLLLIWSKHTCLYIRS